MEEEVAPEVGSEGAAAPVFTKTISINALPAKVWTALTTPALMNRWMSETKIEVLTDWVVGRPFIIRGVWYKTGFENKGYVLAYEPEQHLRYSHLSSLSRLPDVEKHYSVIEFRLAGEGGQTMLSVSVSNFPNEVIYKHLAFYWNVSVELLKKLVEGDEMR